MSSTSLEEPSDPCPSPDRRALRAKRAYPEYDLTEEVILELLAVHRNLFSHN